MNQLAGEKSPYLRQHADNPVAWQPWGPAAFAAAAARDVPVFLSVGYATCHWCHVMAAESFADPGAAQFLNGHFVAIKVDREERPDVDRVYMNYVQALSGQGGWPLSVWLTPAGRPFYGGTYFPPQPRGGRPSFLMVLQALARGWREDRAQLLQEGERGLELVRREAGAGAEPLAADAFAETAGAAVEQCFQYLVDTFDSAHGGFGGAPKFPRASNLNLLFRVAALQGPGSEPGREAVRLATGTLRAMARGGIHDHVGGGFHRYAVDAGWRLPHFEKMLYDQAQIAVNCLEARQATGDERFAWLARDIFGYVQRDLTSPEGAFYTAEDADSAVAGAPGHGEGAFYVWTAAEFRAALGDDATWLADHFGVAAAGNIAAELDGAGEFAGRNVLRQERPLASSARAAGLDLEEASHRLAAALEKLRAVRAGRPRPLRDDKVLTAQNGLMISACARGARILAEPGLAEAARRAAEFLERELYDPATGRLYRTWREGRGPTPGFAEDYAFLIQGLLDLYEATFVPRWLAWARRLQATLDAEFWDPAAGGYFNSRAGDALLIARLKDAYDGAEPTATSVAAANLLRLGALFDDGTEPLVPGEQVPADSALTYRQRGQRAIASLRSTWEKFPPALPDLLGALELALVPPRHVVLTGDRHSPGFAALAATLGEELRLRRAVVAVGPEPDVAWLLEQAGWLRAYETERPRAGAFVCEEYACQPVARTPGELRQRLGQPPI